MIKNVIEFFSVVQAIIGLLLYFACDDFEGSMFFLLAAILSSIWALSHKEE